MGKAKIKPTKKEMSEGKAIMLTVLLLTLVLLGVGYLIKLAVSFFFPGLF